LVNYANANQGTRMFKSTATAGMSMQSDKKNQTTDGNVKTLTNPKVSCQKKGNSAAILNSLITLSEDFKDFLEIYVSLVYQQRKKQHNTQI